MKETKLSEILRGITKEELILFGDFVNSKAFNSNRNVVLLYNYIKSNFSRIAKNGISKNKIYKSIFKNEEIKESKYWKLTSAFCSLLEKFFVYRDFEGDVFYRYNLLLESYRERNLNNLFSILCRDVSGRFQKEFNRGINYFVNTTHFYFQKISYFGYDPANNDENDIETLFENLRMLFIMITITSVSIISNFDNNFIHNSKAKLWMFDEVLSYLYRNRNRMKKNYPTIYVFFLIIYSKLYPEHESYYAELKKSVLNIAPVLSGNLLRHILLNMLNYAVKKLVKGKEKYLKEIFIINKIMHEKNLTFFGQYIQPEYFYSVVEHSAELNELDWINEFMDKYKIYLRKDHKETVINLSLSKIHFTKNEIDDSLKYLLKVNNIKPYFYIAQKILLLQNYYEKNDLRTIRHVMETLNKYLKRRKDIPEETALNCKKFNFYFRKILKLKSSNDKMSLMEELNIEKYFMNKPWLMHKANTKITFSPANSRVN